MLSQSPPQPALHCRVIAHMLQIVNTRYFAMLVLTNNASIAGDQNQRDGNAGNSVGSVQVWHAIAIAVLQRDGPLVTKHEWCTKADVTMYLGSGFSSPT